MKLICFLWGFFLFFVVVFFHWAIQLTATQYLSHVMIKPVYGICEHPRNLISAFVVRCLDTIKL